MQRENCFSILRTRTTSALIIHIFNKELIFLLNKSHLAEVLH